MAFNAVKYCRTCLETILENGSRRNLSASNCHLYYFPPGLLDFRFNHFEWIGLWIFAKRKVLHSFLHEVHFRTILPLQGITYHTSPGVREDKNHEVRFCKTIGPTENRHTLAIAPRDQRSIASRSNRCVGWQLIIPIYEPYPENRVYAERTTNLIRCHHYNVITSQICTYEAVIRKYFLFIFIMYVSFSALQKQKYCYTVNEYSLNHANMLYNGSVTQY